MDKEIYPGIAQTQAFTQETLIQLREKLEKALTGTSYGNVITLVANGSYGRGEVTRKGNKNNPHHKPECEFVVDTRRVW
ncbi:MAG: hypothetical protein M0Q95_08700 [Porticoccaceae bacterium]|nr:hypothetical protein [Porticoccaceae bacterium]